MQNSWILNFLQFLFSGCAQTFPLPYANFKFMPDHEKMWINWTTIDLKGDTGYFVEVTLEYGEDIHSKTESFPLCPENIEITYEMLSPYQKSVLREAYNRKNYKSKKLTSTFNDREKIVLHGLNLQIFLKLGMKLKKVHRVISFSQKPYMKDWVDFCTEKRSKAKSEFAKAYWKLIVNSVFGKTIENIVSQKKVKITTNAESFTKWLNKPGYERHIIVNENICIVILNPETSHVIRPYYIGFSILELSKLIMYDFFYNVLQPYFGEDGLRCLYSDTDSLAILVKSCNILDDLKNLSGNMDFSNLNPNHPLACVLNKAQLFKLKEEFGLRPISRLCALKSKVYSFEIACEHSEGINKRGVCIKCENKSFTGSHLNKLKGIQRKTAREIHFEKYLACLEKNVALRNIVHQITSKKQKISTNVVHKISLSSFDDKRYLLNCGIHSQPFSSKNQPFCSECNV